MKLLVQIGFCWRKVNCLFSTEINQRIPHSKCSTLNCAGTRRAHEQERVLQSCCAWQEGSETSWMVPAVSSAFSHSRSGQHCILFPPRYSLKGLAMFATWVENSVWRLFPLSCNSWRLVWSWNCCISWKDNPKSFRWRNDRFRIVRFTRLANWKALRLWRGLFWMCRVSRVGTGWNNWLGSCLKRLFCRKRNLSLVRFWKVFSSRCVIWFVPKFIMLRFLVPWKASLST